jgi:arylsulfate sulfotransferase
MNGRTYPASKLAFFVCCVLIISACKKNSTSPVVTTTPPSEILVATFPNLSQAGNFSTGSLIKMNYSGEIVKQQTFGAAVFNFRRWIIDGKVLYSYLLYDPNPTPLLGWLAGTVIVTDENLNPIQHIQLIGHPGHDARLDGHEFILLSSTHYIVETYYEQPATNIPDSVPHAANCTVMAPLIQEVNNGKIVFEWNASTFPEFYAASVEGNVFTDTTAQDYMHMNAIFIDPKDNNLVVSFRQTDQIIKINRTTGAIMWRLGNKSDFPITPAQQFLRQHDLTIIGGDTLLFVDNGLAVVRPYSRILEIVLNESNKTITSFKQTLLPAATPFISYMGSVQKNNGIYFVGGGTLPMNFEINATTGQLISEQFLASNSYRAFKY